MLCMGAALVGCSSTVPARFCVSLGCLAGGKVVAGGDSGGGVYVVNGGRFTVVVL